MRRCRIGIVNGMISIGRVCAGAAIMLPALVAGAHPAGAQMTLRAAKLYLPAATENAGKTEAGGAQSALLHKVAVLGRDDRRLLPRRYKDMRRKIGILHNPVTNTLCSAFCVRPNVIATAAHCFFSHKNGQPLNLSAFRFTLNFGRARRGAPRGHIREQAGSARLAGYRSGLSRLYIAAGTSGLRRKPPIGASRDWALARLESNYCRFGTIALDPQPVHALVRASRQRRILQLAYHLDFRNWRLAWSQACEIRRNFGKMRWRNIKPQFRNPEDLVLHTCDTAGASSGSPILMETRQGLKAVAINVGTYQQRNVLIRNGRIIRRGKFRTIANTAVNARAFADLARYLETADIVTSRASLAMIQQRLAALGLYRGKIDGIMGRQTGRAIKVFERQQNRPITGLATWSLLAALNRRKEREAPTAETISTTSMAAIIEDRRSLMLLQQRLQKEGLYDGRIDGIMGEKTEAGIRAFQARLHIPVTGLATTDLLTAPPSDRSAAPRPPG